MSLRRLLAPFAVAIALLSAFLTFIVLSGLTPIEPTRDVVYTFLLINAGTILLQPDGGYWGSALAAPGGLLNASTGLIAVARGGGAGVGLSGDLVNAGTIFVASDAQVVLSPGDAGAAALVPKSRMVRKFTQ